MQRRYLSVLGTLLVAVLVLAACGSPDDDEPEPTVTRIPDAANAPAPTAEPGDEGADSEDEADAEADGEDASDQGDAESDGEGGSVEIVSVDIAFEPPAVEIPADTDVTVVLPNEGAAPHNFSIDELDISVDLAPGETKDVVINAPAGEYEFYCNVPGHREAGMVGTLTVTEGAPLPAAGSEDGEGSDASPEAVASPEMAEVASPEAQVDESASTPDAIEDATPVAREEATPFADGEDTAAAGATPASDGTEATVVAAGDEATVESAAVVGSDESTPRAEQEDATPDSATPTADDESTPQSATPQATPQAATPDASAAEYEIVSIDIAFEPTELEIPADTDVTIVLPNDGAAPHNFSIDELDISVDLAPGELKEIVINAPAGEYEFYCNVPGHREAGMVGVLTVK